MNTLELRVAKSKGYSGKLAGKSYVAAITGKSKASFDRKFLEADEIEWPDNFAWSRKPKATRIDIYRVAEGLYERVEYDERSYVIVWNKNGELARCNSSIERAEEIASLMSEGQDYESARLATRKATK